MRYASFPFSPFSPPSSVLIAAFISARRAFYPSTKQKAAAADNYPHTENIVPRTLRSVTSERKREADREGERERFYLAHSDPVAERLWLTGCLTEDSGGQRSSSNPFHTFFCVSSVISETSDGFLASLHSFLPPQHRILLVTPHLSSPLFSLTGRTGADPSQPGPGRGAFRRAL